MGITWVMHWFQFVKKNSFYWVISTSQQTTFPNSGMYPVRMAEWSKALRSGRSPVFRAWVRIPLLTVHFYFQVNISFSWQTSCAINTNIQLTLIRLCRYRLTTCDQLFGRSKCRHKDFLRSGRTNIPALKVILTDGVFTPLCSVILPSHVIK